LRDRVFPIEVIHLCPTQETQAEFDRADAAWLRSSRESTLSDLDHNVLSRGRIALDDVPKKRLVFVPEPPGIPARLRGVTGGLRIHYLGASDGGVPASIVELREVGVVRPEIVLRADPDQTKRQNKARQGNHRPRRSLVQCSSLFGAGCGACA
jgi:hypothetical protein